MFILQNQGEPLYEWIPSTERSPVHPYYDAERYCDDEPDAKDVQQDLESLLAVLCNRHGIDKKTIAISQSHGKVDQGFKVSFHFVVGGPVSTPAICRQNAAEMNAQLGQSRILFDEKVYKDRQCMRTLYASKEGEARPLLPVSHADDDLAHIIQTGVPGADHDMSGERKIGDRAGTTPRAAPDTKVSKTRLTAREEEAILREIKALGVPALTKPLITFTPKGSLLISTRTTTCAIAGRQHTNNHIFYVIARSTSSIKQKCHSPSCEGRESSVGWLSEPLAARIFGDRST